MHLNKMFLTCFLIFVMMATHAQFKQGDRMLGTSLGSVFYNSGTADISVASIGSNTSLVKNWGVSITPSLGWFVSDKTVIGASLNINPNGQKTTYEQSGTTYQSDKSTGFNIGLGGFARNYFSGSSSFLPFGQVSVNAGLSNLKTEGFFYGSSYKQTYTGNSNGGFFANATFSGGATKMIGDNAGLDIYIGYSYSYNKNTFAKTTLRDIGNDGTIDERLENETTTKFTNHGFTVGVGFQVFLRKKK